MARRDSGRLDPERGRLSPDRERTRIVDEVLRDQARREVLRHGAYRRPTSSRSTRVVAGVVTLVALGVWLFPIPRLRPAIEYPVAPADEAAALRVAAYVQAQQVEAFRLATGRLPDVLRETGEPLPGMGYERLDARTYRIIGASRQDTVRWLSSDSLPALLDDPAAARLRAIVR